jgi:hypothetical protein
MRRNDIDAWLLASRTRVSAGVLLLLLLQLNVVRAADAAPDADINAVIHCRISAAGLEFEHTLTHVCSRTLLAHLSTPGAMIRPKHATWTNDKTYCGFTSNLVMLHQVEHSMELMHMTLHWTLEEVLNQETVISFMAKLLECANAATSNQSQRNHLN